MPTGPPPDEPSAAPRRRVPARGGRPAAEVGRQALVSLRRQVSERLVGALDDRDPDLLAKLAEIGVVRRQWMQDPDSGPMAAPPVEVAQRLLERAVERRPSLLAQLGLSAVQLLSAPGGALGGAEGVSQQLVVMFTDLEGFTAYTSRQGDEAAGVLLTAHHRTVGPLIRGRGGRMVKRLGDGLLLTFPDPHAAVLAGLDLVASRPAPLRLRAGAHRGDVLVLPDDVIGHTVNVAARVTELARGGQVLVTSDLTSALGPSPDGVRFSRVRRRHLKGLDDPIGVCRAEPAPDS